jgi:hypothetical protein
VFPEVANTQFGVFTRSQALSDGWNRSGLAHAVARGRLRQSRTGAFVIAELTMGHGPESDRKRLTIVTIAALLTTRRAVASHAAAAVLADLPVWRLPQRPCLTVPPRHTGDVQDVHLHRAALPSSHVRPALSSRRTSAARTIVDLAREHGVEQAVVTADAALRRGFTTRADLEGCLARCVGWPGIRRACTAVTLVDGRAESPLESVSRLRLAGEGLPAPLVQADIFDASGTWLARTDMYWEQFGVAGEADGRLKYHDEALWDEKLRQERLEDAGLVIVRWGHADLADPTRLAARIRAAFARAARRPASERRFRASAAMVALA